MAHSDKQWKSNFNTPISKCCLYQKIWCIKSQGTEWSQNVVQLCREIQFVTWTLFLKNNTLQYLKAIFLPKKPRQSLSEFLQTSCLQITFNSFNLLMADCWFLFGTQVRNMKRWVFLKRDASSVCKAIRINSEFSLSWALNCILSVVHTSASE